MILAALVLGGILVLACYLPTFVVFHDHSRPVSLAQVGMYTTLGMGSLGVVGMCARAAGLDMRLSVIPGLVLAAYALFRYQQQCVPVIPSVSWDGHLWVAIMISIVYLLHILIPGIRIGRGAYPAVFFNVDSAYYLGQIQAFLRDPSWPPISLSFAGEALGYHYGAQITCALLSALTGILPHTAAFLVYMALTTLGILCAAWEIVRTNAPERRFLWGGGLLLLFGAFYPIDTVWIALQNPRSTWLPGLWHIILDPQTFNSGYRMLSIQMGIFLTLLLLVALQDFSNAAHQRLAAWTVGILIVFKSPYMITVGMGFGLYVLVSMMRTRRWQIILSPIAALSIGLVLHLLAKSTEAVTVMVKFGVLFANPGMKRDLFGIFFIYAPLLLMFAFARRERSDHPLLSYGGFLLAPMAFANMFALVRTADLSVYESGLFQTVHLTPLFLGMAALAGLRACWKTWTPRMRSAYFFAMIAIAMMPLLHNLLHTGVFLFAPECGHEYVDNRLLAEALRRIPVEGTVVVTNDFRYPAGNYKRDLRQMQFPALFGHQAYAVNFVYERYPDSKQRLALQQRFRKPGWDAELEQIAQKLGWTHLVIHRASPHPDPIPLPLLFENSAYQVYIFTSAQ